MDSRRLIIFIVVSLGLLLVWEKYFTPEKVADKATVTQSTAVTDVPGNVAQVASSANQMVADNSFNLTQGQTIMVTTNVLQAQISTAGGDIRGLELLTQGSQDNAKQPYALLMNNKDRIFIAQTGLIAANTTIGAMLPNHNTVYTTDKYNYAMTPTDDVINVVLHANAGDGVEILKTLTFKRGSYVVDVSYQIVNNTDQALTGVAAYWRILRDEASPEGETRFVHTFTGPVYYTDDSKFNTIKYDNLSKSDLSYPETTNNGWVGFIQHYFTTLWLLDATGYPKVCSDGVQCRLNFKKVDNNLASAGLLTDLPPIKAHSAYSIAVPLFAGPEEYNVMLNTAPHLELTKDYGWVYIFATPLFWLLVKLFDIVKNWGWAIILLTVVVKSVLYPLTRASYISMGKMKALAPKMEKLKAQYKDDKPQLQKAMMEMYRSEKVNPIGGCLPMLLQIPVFIGLYWALLSSVELRQASFLWVHDLSTPDPYYILPVILAVTMYLQTFLNPPPADPVQAKMMKIMPVAFSVMFFFFPAGLVLYWLVNNILTMAQQYYVNNHVSLRKKNRDNKQKTS